MHVGRRKPARCDYESFGGGISDAGTLRAKLLCARRHGEPDDGPLAEPGAERHGDGNGDLWNHSTEASESRRGGETQLSAVAGLHQCRLSISGTLETCGQPHIEVRLWVILF